MVEKNRSKWFFSTFSSSPIYTCLFLILLRVLNLLMLSEAAIYGTEMA